MTTEEAEARFNAFRRAIERRAKEAEDLEAKAKAIKAEIHAEQTRINQGLPESDACPDCWVKRGETVIFVARTADDHANFDRWGCPNCGWYFDVPLR